MKPCRVCSLPVTPWKGRRRPFDTIHRECLVQRCRFCHKRFVVGKERKGLFCCNEHLWSFMGLRFQSARAAREDGRLA